MIFNLISRYKPFIFSLSFLLLSSCDSELFIPSAQQNFTQTWQNLLNKYLNSETSIRETHWYDQINNHINQKINIKNWYGTVTEVGDSFSGKYITVEYAGIRYYIYPKGEQINYLKFEPGMKLLFSGILNKNYTWDTVDKPGLYVYNTKIQNIAHSIVYFSITDSEMEELLLLLEEEAEADGVINQALDELNEAFEEAMDEVEQELDNMLDEIEKELDNTIDEWNY